MKRETEIYYKNCVDAVLVENYSGSCEDCEVALYYLNEHYKGAGITADTVAEKLMYSDGVTVGSRFKENHHAYGEVVAEYIKEFM